MSSGQRIVSTTALLALVLLGTSARAAVTLPSVADPAAAWKDFLGTASLEETTSAYESLAPMYNEQGEAAEDCRSRLDRLDAAIAKVPVGVALWYAGYQCGQARGDDALAARYGDGLAKLAAYALGSGNGFPDSPPIKVLNVNDANALVEATGMEFRYSFIDATRMPQHYPMHVALWDAKGNSERHLVFDYLEPLFLLRSADVTAGYPGQRTALRDGFLKEQVNNGYSIGEDLSAAKKAEVLDSTAEKLALLREPAASGGLNSIQGWLKACVKQPMAGCGEGLVDALLPYAEKQFAMHKVELALAYGNGVGVPRNPDAAMLLVDSAEKAWGGGNAIAYYAAQMLALDDKPLPAGVIAKLAQAEAGGSTMAAAIRMQALLRESNIFKLSPSTLALVLDLAGRGYPLAQSHAAAHYAEVKDTAKQMRWRRKAAESGDAASMELLGHALVDADGVARNETEGVAWLRKAAIGGEPAAMRFMGWNAQIHGQWSEAERWYASALSYEDIEGALNLANLYADEHPGVNGNGKRAVELYEWMDKVFDKPVLRRAFASMLMNAKSVRDPARAEGLLRKDAEHGDHDSEFMLGMSQLNGKLKAADSSESMRWIDKGLAGDNGAKAAELAHWLYYKQGTGESRKRGIELTRKAADRGYPPALNNLAWFLCTSEEPRLRSIVEGNSVAARMGDPEALDAGRIDSIAACEAAAGRFDKAVALQDLALAKLAFFPSTPATTEGLKSRRELYARKQVFVEPAGAGAEP